MFEQQTLPLKRRREVPAFMVLRPIGRFRGEDDVYERKDAYGAWKYARVDCGTHVEWYAWSKGQWAYMPGKDLDGQVVVADAVEELERCH